MSDFGYDEAIEYLTTLKGGSINPGLERIRNLLKVMGDPQDDLKIVHVAGTNGKGSLIAFLSSILSMAGYRVGVYTSPAVFTYRERYRIGKRNISEKDLIRGTEIVRASADIMAGKGLDTPSAFEAETALAFWYFKDKACDIVILETGMGGLLDATNVITAPLLSVIASVSFDHMNFLGDTLESIASNKAGIIKSGCPVVSAQQHPEAGEVIKRTAAGKGCELSEVSESAIRDRRVAKASLTQVFDYKNYQKLKISLSGKYQLKNAALAIETVEALRKKGVKITDRAMYAGLEDAKWPGRFEFISHKPDIVIDGAHNEEAAQRLRESIDFYFTNRRVVIIMGMLRDKDLSKVCEYTVGASMCVFTVSTRGSRGLGAIELADTVKTYNQNVTAADSPFEALEMAKAVAGPDGAVVVFGSLSFLKDITAAIKR